MSYDSAHPTEKHARLSIISSPDVGWDPEVVCSMSSWLRLIVGFERFDLNIEAPVYSWDCGRRLRKVSV